MSTTPISVQLADSLADKILKEQLYKPGQKLPTERVLAEELGVSRTSIREASKQLEARGLVEIRHGVGTFVTNNPGVVRDPLGIDDEPGLSNVIQILEDWYKVRMILEGEAMEMVVQYAAEEELDHLTALFDTEVRQLNAGESDAFLSTDQSFHCALARATHNIIMMRLIPSLHATVYYDMVKSLVSHLRPRFDDNATQNHRNILNHLKLRDGRGANLAMRYHMLRAIEDLHLIGPDAPKA